MPTRPPRVQGVDLIVPAPIYREWIASGDAPEQAPRGVHLRSNHPLCSGSYKAMGPVWVGAILLRFDDTETLTLS